MASDQAGMPSFFGQTSPFALLVNAANAQSQETSKVENSAQDSSAKKQETTAGDQDPKAGSAPQGEGRQANVANLELQEAIQREALQREALQQQAALVGLGTPNSGLPAQESEYLQQFRLEALVQQRRQDTLAQLALAQDAGMSQDIQALLQAQQLRRAALMRQEFLRSTGTGLTGSLEQQLGALGGGVPSGGDGLLLRQYLAEKEREHKLTAITGVSVAPPFGGTKPPEVRTGPENVTSGLSQKPGVPTANKVSAAIDEGSKMTVLPCRARGMPMDHNGKTAYFIVTEDIKHGTELVCSYYACRNAGIKFRYCTYCKLPVAKRNFCKRHKHTGKIPASSLPEGSVEGIESYEAKREEINLPVKKAERGGVIDAATLLGKLIEKGSKEVVVGESQTQENTSLSSEEAAQMVKERRAVWNQLLQERPRDPGSMVSWVEAVLSVSDPTSVLEDADVKHATGSRATPNAATHPSASSAHNASGNLDQDHSEGKLDIDQATTSKTNANLTGYNKKGVDGPGINETERSELEYNGHEKYGQEDDSETKGENDMHVSDADSTESEESVDLRANKRQKAV